MSYSSYSNTEAIHTLTVTGKIGPEAARLLVDTQEKITALGHKCELLLKIEASESTPAVAKNEPLPAR